MNTKAGKRRDSATQARFATHCAFLERVQLPMHSHGAVALIFAIIESLSRQIVVEMKHDYIGCRYPFRVDVNKRHLH